MAGGVVARSEATKQSTSGGSEPDCFASLAMTAIRGWVLIGKIWYYPPVIGGKKAISRASLDRGVVLDMGAVERRAHRLDMREGGGIVFSLARSATP